MKTQIALAALAAATLAAGAASAQPPRQPGPAAGPSITLYDLPNYQGASRTYATGVSNLADLGLNDRAQSARVNGRWQVCEDANFRGRCTEISGDIANLATVRMTVAISSFQPLDRPQQPDYRDQRGFGGAQGGPGGYDRGYGDRGPPPPPPAPPGYDDRNFGGQSLEGRSATFFPRPVPGPYRGADEFCRRLGFSGSIYADTSRGFEIRDVLCRR